MGTVRTAVQNKKAETAYFPSKQFLPSDFAEQSCTDAYNAADTADERGTVVRCLSPDLLV